jgi:hypothetical protein
MKQQIWKQDYLIASYLVNLRGQAGLYAMLNLIQDVGWMHAMHLQVKLPKNLGWIFTRQKLFMSEWPTWNTTVSIQTWLRKPENDTFLFRDYEIFLGARKIGECTSSFTVMDLSTRKMASQDWSEYSDLWRPDGYLEHKPAKIPLAKETVDWRSLKFVTVTSTSISMSTTRDTHNGCSTHFRLKIFAKESSCTNTK